MIKRTLLLAIAGALLATAAPVAIAAVRAGSIEITGAWSRPAPQGGNGVGYAVLTNRGKPDRLAGASSPAAARVEIHESMVMGGKAMMHPRPRGLELPAGKATALAPEGWHLMLVGLKRPLKVGETVPVTLKFEKSGSVVAAFQVQARAPAAAMSGMDHSGH